MKLYTHTLKNKKKLTNVCFSFSLSTILPILFLPFSPPIQVLAKVHVVNMTSALVTLGTKHLIAPNVPVSLDVHGVILPMLTIKPTITVNVVPMVYVTVKLVNVPVTTDLPVMLAVTRPVLMAVMATVLVNTSMKLPPTLQSNTVVFPIVLTIFGMQRNHASVNVTATGLAQTVPNACAHAAMTHLLL